MSIVEANETSSESWCRLRASFTRDQELGYTGYPGQVVLLIDALQANESTAILFVRRSHESLLLVSHADYYLWRTKPFIAAVPQGNGQFAVHFWGSVGGALRQVTATSLEAAVEAVLSGLPLPPS